MSLRSLLIGLGLLVAAGASGSAAQADDAKSGFRGDRDGAVVRGRSDERTRARVEHRGRPAVVVPDRRDDRRYDRRDDRCDDRVEHHGRGRSGHGPVVFPGRRVVVSPRRPLPRYRWVEGRYEIRETEVWIPGFYREERVPAKYREFCGPRGLTIRVLVRAAYTRRIWVPGHHETRCERVWIPGHYVAVR